MSKGCSNADIDHATGSFPQSRWTLVARARGATSGAKRALNELCLIYWYPLYYHVRRRGFQHADAENAIQDFILRLFGNEFFARADPAKGRLRAFLKASLDHYLVDEFRRAVAEKRGGRIDFVPLDMSGAEERYIREPADNRSPDKDLDRKWALLVLQRSIDRLRARWEKKGKTELFTVLSPFLFAELVSLDTRRVAERFETTEGNVRQILKRMRDEFPRAFREEVADTVDSEESVEHEMAALRAALS